MMFPMPTLVMPPGMPEDVVSAIQTVGSRLRTELLHSLSRADGPLSTPELVALVKANRITTRDNLHALEDAGLVRANFPRHERGGRKVLWSVDQEKINELAERWKSYVSAVASPDEPSS